MKTYSQNTQQTFYNIPIFEDNELFEECLNYSLLRNEFDWIDINQLSWKMLNHYIGLNVNFYNKNILYKVELNKDFGQMFFIHIVMCLLVDDMQHFISKYNGAKKYPEDPCDFLKCIISSMEINDYVEMLESYIDMLLNIYEKHDIILDHENIKQWFIKYNINLIN